MREPKPKAAHTFERDGHDWYVEPIWCSSRLFESGHIKSGHVLDPACGRGHIVASALVHNKTVAATDIVKRSNLCAMQLNFLTQDMYKPRAIFPSACVSNPPYKLATEFIKKALSLDFAEIAFFLPSNFQYGDATGRFLEMTPLAEILAITPRPSCLPGNMIENGETPQGATKNSSWYIWRRGHKGRPVAGWLRRED